jgi:hypothetical protein
VHILRNQSGALEGSSVGLRLPGGNGQLSRRGDATGLAGTLLQKSARPRSRPSGMEKMEPQAATVSYRQQLVAAVGRWGCITCSPRLPLTRSNFNNRLYTAQPPHLPPTTRHPKHLQTLRIRSRTLIDPIDTDIHPE